MNLLFCILQYLLGLLPFRRLALAPVRSPRGRRCLSVAAKEWRDYIELGSFGRFPLQNVEPGSYVFARLLPSFTPAQALRALRRRNQRHVYEPGSPGGPS